MIFKHGWSVLVLLLVASFSLGGAVGFQAKADEQRGDPEIQPDFSPRPVDDDMHHFMEYVYEPGYLRLREKMAVEPVDKKQWKAIKGDALTLAEASNLLLLRAPAAQTNYWKELSAAVRQHGGELYQSARKSDYQTARQAYVNMLERCNACHMRFAAGAHQLEP